MALIQRTEPRLFIQVKETLDFGAVAEDGGVLSLTVAVPGARPGDSVILTVPSGMHTDGLIFHAVVSAVDVVGVSVTNTSTLAGALNPAAGIVTVLVIRMT